MEEITDFYSGRVVTFALDEALSYVYDNEVSIQDALANKIIPTNTSFYKLNENSVVKANQFGKRVALLKKEYINNGFGSFVSNLNGLLHYQSLVDNGILDGVVVDLSGRIESGLLEWMNGKLIGDNPYGANIELNYRLVLPSNKEYVFTLKSSKDQSCVLEPTNDEYLYSKEDLSVIRGFQSLIKYEPLKITQLLSSSVELEKFYENIWESSLLQKNKESLINIQNERELAAKKCGIYNAHPYLNEYDALSLIEGNIRSLQDNINSSEEMKKIKKSYLLTGETIEDTELKIKLVANKVYEHIKVLQKGNMEVPASLVGVDVEQVELDIQHIIIDVIQDVNKNNLKRGRSYSNPERFLTSSLLKEEMLIVGEDLKINPTYKMIVGSKDKTTNFDGITEHKISMMLTKIYADNISKIKEQIPNFEKERLLPEDRKAFQLLSQQLVDIGKLQQELGQEISQYSKNKVADFEQEKLDALYVKKEELLMLKFAVQVEAHNIVMGYFSKNTSLLAQWDNVTTKLLMCKQEKSVKYIYVLNHRGELVFSPEKLDSDTQGRASHSELAEGKHVYAAGEIEIGLSATGEVKVLELNNGSGHYRPPPKTVMSAFEQLRVDGFDVSETKLVNSLGRFAKLKEAAVFSYDYESNNKTALHPLDFSCLTKFRKACVKDKLHKPSINTI